MTSAHVVVACVALSALLAAVVCAFVVLAGQRARLERQIAERTARLDATLHDLEAIVAAVPSTIGYWDRDLVNRMANRAYADTFGRDPATLPGTTLRELVGDEAFEQGRPRIEGVLRGEPQRFELSRSRTHGQAPRHLQVRFVPDVVDGEVKGFYAFTHDVTELVNGRLELAAAQRAETGLLRTIHEHAIVSVADRAGRILEVNDSFCRISGYTREQLVGQNHRIVNSGLHTREFWREVWGTISSGVSWRGEVCNRRADGSIYWVDSIISPYVGDDGRVEKYISIRTDITARRESAEDLRKTNERFEIAARAAGIGVWTYDVAADRLSWDGMMFELYGRSPAKDEPAIALWSSSLHPADRARAEAEFAAALAGTRPFDTEFRIVRPDEGVRHVKAVGRVDRQAQGRALQVTGVNIDITERKRAELALRATSSLLTTVLASASEVSIIATDARLRVTVFNKGAERLLGYTSEEVVGLVTPELFHDPDEMRARAAGLATTLGRILQGGAVFTEPSTLGQASEWTYIRKDGTRVPVSLVCTEMRDAGGELFGYLGIAHDVTSQKVAERSLREAVHKAKSANRAKSQFLANMSHEIRTPMNAVIGLSYLLERTPLDPQQAGFLSKIRLASKSLLAIINDILDLSKIEAAELRIERAPFDLGQLLGEQVDLMATQAEAKGVEFVVDVPPSLPTVEGDAARLRQVLTNLLSNAIKFTDSGSVALRAYIVATAANCVRARFVVEDSGIGIASDALRKIFSPFAQADASTTRRFGGTGLGLSIVKQLVALMGGEIGVTSTPGIGSSFWVELDFTLAAEQLPADSVRRTTLHRGGQGLRGVRVLVADDSDINLEVAQRILELEGATVTLARNGQEAVDHLLAAPEGFDAVLLDVQMPVLDGHDATRRIRDGLGLVELPIIALTAGTLTSEAALALAAGMSDFVGKPFEPAMLVRTIRKFVTVPEGRPLSVVPKGRRTAPTDWPRLEGVDANDAYLRMRDRDLFLAMLKRLLDDFADLQESVDAEGPEALAEMVARLHNLKGTAGTIGAKEIQVSAGAAEAAFVAGDTSTGRASTLHAAALLEALRRSSALVLLDLEAGDALDAPDEPADVPDLSTDAMAELVAMLRASNLAATDRFEELSLPLRRLLGNEAYGRLSTQLERLELGKVADALDARLSAVSTSPRPENARIAG